MTRFRIRQRGFTLTELMIAVAIVGVLLAIAIPNISRVVRKDEIRKAARMSSAIYSEFRGEATASGRAMYVLMFGDTAGFRWHYVFAQPGPSCLDWNFDDMLYLDYNFLSSQAAAVVPNDPNIGSSGWSYTCIKPSGRLVEFVFGVETNINQPITIDVYDKDRPDGDRYMVRVGLNASGKVY